MRWWWSKYLNNDSAAINLLIKSWRTRGLWTHWILINQRQHRSCWLPSVSEYFISLLELISLSKKLIQIRLISLWSRQSTESCVGVYEVSQSIEHFTLSKQHSQLYNAAAKYFATHSSHCALCLPVKCVDQLYQAVTMSEI